MSPATEEGQEVDIPGGAEDRQDGLHHQPGSQPKCPGIECGSGDVGRRCHGDHLHNITGKEAGCRRCKVKETDLELVRSSLHTHTHTHLLYMTLLFAYILCDCMFVLFSQYDVNHPVSG